MSYPDEPRIPSPSGKGVVKPLKTAIDPALCQEFLEALPPHLYQLIRYCKIKATSSNNLPATVAPSRIDTESRSIYLIAPNIHFARSILAQAELRVVRDRLRLTELRVFFNR